MNYIKHLTAVFGIMDNDPRLTPFHVSLYMSLFRCWNSNFFHNPVSISRDEIMKMAKIGSANTYVRCLKELHFWNYIRYEPSYNRHKGSLVYLYSFDNSTDNASVMPVRPSINKINIINKENLIEQAQNFESKKFDMKSNEEEKEKFRQKKKNEETNSSGSIPPPLEHVKIYFDEKNFPAVEAEKFFNYFESNGWLVGGRAKMKDWKAAARNWILNIPKFVPKPKPSQPNPSQPNTPKNYGEPL
ncbi:MAG TPA: hypothetical protein VIH57_11380 [Bacteroidales bacterium]